MTSRQSLCLRLLLAAAVMLLCGADAFVLSARVVRAQSGGGSGGQAGLVIEHGDGSVDTYCVGFSGDSITGAQLLSRAGIGVVQFNGAVCAVGNQEGCFQPHDFASCYCDSYPPKNLYWSFFTAKPGQPWVYSPVGFASAAAKNGDLQAWRWGVGGPNNAPPPPAISFQQVCASSALEPTATSSQPATVQPTAVASSPTAGPANVSATVAVPTSTAAPPQASTTPGTSTVATPDAPTTGPTVRVTITNHGTATATPQAPSAGTKAAGSGSGVGGLLAFVAVAALLGVATIGALVRRRQHGR